MELARSLGADTVELDLSIPFTAARARNEGFARLLELAPDIEFVQFVDGDCELVDGWLDRAYSELAAKPDVAAVCGRRRERYPTATIYNQLCDIEWAIKPRDLDQHRASRVVPVRNDGCERPRRLPLANVGFDPEFSFKAHEGGFSAGRVAMTASFCRLASNGSSSELRRILASLNNVHQLGVAL